jgi:hypothetical protein
MVEWMQREIKQYVPTFFCPPKFQKVQSCCDQLHGTKQWEDDTTKPELNQ